MSIADLTPVDFSGEDGDCARRFAALRPSIEFGLRRFPAPEQYHQLVRQILDDEPTAEPRRLYALAQRDWHVRGQNGCQFARIAALKAESLRWQYLVIPDLDEAAVVAIGQYLGTINQDPTVEVASLLFPSAQAGLSALGIMRRLVARTSFWLEKDEEIDGARHMHLRHPVGLPGRTVQAWVMGFAPFEFMPNTRRGPYFELALRVKAKPEWIFHRLTPDRGVAHLADVPLTMSDAHWEHRWQTTLARTRMILAGEPDEVSAAKSTFAVPTSTDSAPAAII